MASLLTSVSLGEQEQLLLAELCRRAPAGTSRSKMLRWAVRGYARSRGFVAEYDDGRGCWVVVELASPRSERSDLAG